MTDDSVSDRAILGRRSFLFTAAALAAAAPVLTEGTMAEARLRSQMRGVLPDDAVIINANENPLGPCKAALDAITAIAPSGGRYDRSGILEKFTNEYAKQQGVTPDSVAVYAGSSEPLHYMALAYTSPTRSFVTADPSYESPAAAATVAGAKTIRVPLTAGFAHDVKAMVAADPHAGLIYICNPNNPTGTITPREDILWALDNKPKGAILLVDEAYIHLSDEQSVVDQVAAGKDIVVLRTFSKIYGMAGIRCGVALGRPDLLGKLQAYYQNQMPVTSVAAAYASITDPELIPIRKKIIGDNRRETLAWLKASGYAVVGSPKSNCFMIQTDRDAHSVIAGMVGEKVYIGRVWPVWPKAVRISVGTADDMAKFRVAFKKVMDAPPVKTAALDMDMYAPKTTSGAIFLS